MKRSQKLHLARRPQKVKESPPDTTLEDLRRELSCQPAHKTPSLLRGV